MKENQVPFHRYFISLICMAIISGGFVYINTSRAISQSSQEKQDELAKIHVLFESIKQDYYEDVDPEILVEGALKGMAEALDDPYTSYLNPEDADAFSEMLMGEFEGIGATLRLKEDRPIIAEEPAKNSPAAKSGLQMDDVILKVDGKETKDEDLNEVVSWIRGEKGTTVLLTIQREAEVLDVEVTREMIPVETLFFSIDENEPSVGKIEIVTFGEKIAMELQNAIQELRKEGATAFVLDVRGNPGGYLDQVEVMTSMFLEDGATILKIGNKEEIIGEVKASKDLDKGFKVTEPVVVLVDGASASASEILAAALQESAGIPIVGTQTFGKGTVQGVRSFGDQSELKMTMQKWLTPEGNWLNEVGLTPDVQVDFPEYAYLPSLVQNRLVEWGEEGEKVEQLNQFLEALGYLDQVENQFNEQTKQAIEAFQADNELPVTGILDFQTALGMELSLAETLKETDPMYQKALEVLLEK